MSLTSKPITATGKAGPKLKPGSYYVTVRAWLNNPNHDPVTGFCVVTQPTSTPPESEGEALGGAFALAGLPRTPQRFPGPESAAFSYSGVLTLTKTTQPGFGCQVTSATETITVTDTDVQWWIVSA